MKNTATNSDFNWLAAIPFIGGPILAFVDILVTEMGVAPSWLIWLHQH